MSTRQIGAVLPQTPQVEGGWIFAVLAAFENEKKTVELSKQAKKEVIHHVDTGEFGGQNHYNIFPGG